MEWISINHKTAGVPWKEEGWFFNKVTEDYAVLIQCKICNRAVRVDQCEKRAVRSAQGDECGAPVFHLCCPSFEGRNCWGVLATIDESEAKNRPLLYLEKDGAFVDSPE